MVDVLKGYCLDARAEAVSDPVPTSTRRSAGIKMVEWYDESDTTDSRASIGNNNTIFWM